MTSMPRARRWGIVGAIAVVVVLIAAACDFQGTAAAQSVPAPGGAVPNAADLQAVSCVPSGDCVAAGRTAALRSHGTWTELPSPPDWVSDLSCVSATDCVGIHRGSGSDQSELYVFDGTTWTPTMWPGTPDLGSGGNLPLAVSCASLTSCMITSYQGGIRRWDGSSLTDTTLPSANDLMADVSCPTVSFCLAVGGSIPAPGSAVALEWTGGTSWTAVPLSGIVSASLYRVSCANPSVCVTTDSSGDFQLGTWNGTTLTGGTTQTMGPYDVGYARVACASTTVSECQVSWYQSTLAQWGSQTVHSVGGGPSLTYAGALFGLSCSSATDCVAIGELGTNQSATRAAWHFDGTSWTQDTSWSIPNYADTEATSLSCPSSTFCMMGGTYVYGSTRRPYVRRWNGSTWTTTPLFPATYLGDASADDVWVSCTSSTACVAVVSRASAGEQDLETWDGASWVQQTLDTFGAVMGCAGPTYCLVAGWYGFEPDNESLKVWDGTQFTDGGADVVSGSPVDAISCNSPTHCVLLLGDPSDFGYASYTEVWNGSTLSAPVGVPAPAGENAVMTSLSCPATGSCRLVGAVGAPGDTAGSPYVVEGDGTSWNAVTLPVSGPGALTDVSCVSSAECLAIGSATAKGSPDSELLLAESGAGKWYMAPDLPMSGSTPVAYDHISCVPTWCAAVGEYPVNAHPTVTSAIYTWTDGS
jgi:hypothetical protein